MRRSDEGADVSDPQDISELVTRGDATPVTQSERGPDEPAELPLGQSLGRYVVLETLGRGGMGRVLRAYDPKLEREVALKVLRTDVLDAEAQLRLVREARAMAKLSHPNVVAVYDAEETGSGVVLVMELVRGPTLQQWVRQGPPSRARIVARYREAGRGLAAAHAEGLLHRDFKPSNVLVPEQGGAKVTDFGLAKLSSDIGSTESPSGASAPPISDAQLTQAGTVLGTPRYMAPEQHMGVPLDAAIDQYAFCVALWEALAGAPPFKGTFEQLLKLKAKGPPRWPDGVSVPRPIVDALERGLAVEPADRWPDMEALLGALAPESGRRRRTVVMLSGIVGLAGLGGAAVFGWIGDRGGRCSGAVDRMAGVWDEERRAEVEAAILGTELAYARDAWARAERQLDDYADAWVAMHTETCEATTVRGEQSPELMDRRMACLGRAREDLRAVVDVLAVVDETGVQRMHQIVVGLPPLARCSDVEALQAGVPPPPAEEQAAVDGIRQVVARARVQRRAGRYEDARAGIEEATTALQQVRYGPIGTEVELERGQILEDLGEFEASDAALRRALERGVRHGQWRLVQDAASTLMYVVGYRQGHPVEALRYRELAVALAVDDPTAQAELHGNLGAVALARAEYAEAEAEYRRALELWLEQLGPDDFHVATTRNNLASTLQYQGRHAEAEVELRQALQIRREVLGDEHPDVAGSRDNLAVVLAQQGHLEQAEAEFREVLALRTKLLGPSHLDVVYSWTNLGAVQHEQGKEKQAEANYRRGLELQIEILGADHLDTAVTRHNLGVTLAEQQRHAEAEQEHRRALALRTEHSSPDHPLIATSHHLLATTLHAQGRLDEAIAEYRQALELRSPRREAEPVPLARTRYGLVEALLEQGDHEPALALARQAWADAIDGELPPQWQGLAAFALARALWAAGDDRPRARTLARRAAKLLREAGEDASEVRTWLRARR